MHFFFYPGNCPRLISEPYISYLVCVISIFHISGKYSVGLLLLLGAVPFYGSFWIRVVFPFIIYSGMSISCKHWFRSVMDVSELLKPVSMYAIKSWCFAIWWILWVNRGLFSPSVLLLVLLTLFIWCLSIRHFCDVLLVAIIWSKIVLFPWHPVVSMSSCILPLLVGRIFKNRFGTSRLVYFVLPSLDIFLVFILSLVTSCFFPRVVIFTCLPFCPNIFQRSSSDLSFLLVVKISYLRFQSNFPSRFWVSVRIL